MKSKILTGLLTGLVVAASTAALFSQPSRAGNNSFFCATLNRQPVTFARNSRGSVPLVRWTSNSYFPPPWTAQRRCQEVVLLLTKTIVVRIGLCYSLSSGGVMLTLL
ncbi:MAG: hypothetical protein EAZ09_14390 [Oscillatoriales cyanobacterium]|nr:MAG: hypothetical protein EAZ09_14390 [Oscillatoriales cyanobacterium]